jgi:hypothetical protein
LQASLRSLHRFDCCRDPSGTGSHAAGCGGGQPYPAPGRQILLHPVAGGPTHNPGAMQIENDSKVEPAFRSPDIGDVSYGFASVQLRFHPPTFGWPWWLQSPRPASWQQRLDGGCYRWLPLRLPAGRALRTGLCRRVRTGLIPLVRISRPTRRSPASRPTSLSSAVMRGRPLRLPARQALRINRAAKAQAVLLSNIGQRRHIRQNLRLLARWLIGRARHER